nr:MAG: hypothetical protein [Aspergillus flavus virga-like virus 1]
MIKEDTSPFHHTNSTEFSGVNVLYISSFPNRLHSPPS